MVRVAIKLKEYSPAEKVHICYAYQLSPKGFLMGSDNGISTRKKS
jgi:hypothetical protein